ncbi:TIGR01777 family oxidoreductase [Dyadobacter tibetensis]|uniref:TIGR01777 family oxidoreductase n=1 Tax=Dyadobacter tibetensis TaxID=1211851 RepID=UPI00046EBC41|nr:TIGR01777 family oxidoreductase [Dyadobacter tibetensis]
MAHQILITGGTGLVGTRLTTLLKERGYSVGYLSRSKDPIKGVSVFRYDTKNNFLEEGALEGVEHLIHLAGAGVADGRWTEDRKKVIIDSRTETIKLVAQKLKDAQISLKSFISASGSSYYGQDTGNAQHTEDAPAGKDFLSEVTVLWEKAADQISNLGVRTVKLRTGVVLSLEGGALPKIAQPAKLGLGAPLGSGSQWMSWIHVDDLCRLYIEALENESWYGTYNAVASPPVTNADLTKQICEVLNRPQFLPNVPAFALRLAFGEMASVVLGSNYVINHRIANETNFIYEFPDLKEALKNLYHQQ